MLEMKIKPKRRSRDELRTATLHAARSIIASDGPEALTARRLAADVGYAPGTIYNLFSDLQEVLWEVNRDNFARISTLFDGLEGGAEQQLRALALRYIGLVSAQPEVFRALFEGPRKTASFPKWYMDAIGVLLERIALQIGHLAPMTPRAARREADRLFASIHGIAALHASQRLDLISATPAAELADGLVARVVRDIRANG